MEIETDSSDQWIVHDRFVWVNSLTKYLTEVKTNCLDLRCSKIDVEEILSVLNLISNKPQIIELHFGESDSKEMEGLSELLAKTNVTKLNLGDLDLSYEEFWLLIHSCASNQMIELVFRNSENYVEDIDSLNNFFSTLLGSQLKNFDAADLIRNDYRPLLLQIIHNTSLTQLDLSFTVMEEAEGILTSLFSNLHLTSIKNLKLCEVLTGLNPRVIKMLSENLRLSKVQNLDLGWNRLCDDELDILVEGLVHSKVTHLNLSLNNIQGNTTLGYHLKDTYITQLNLSKNPIVHLGIFLSPDFLRLSPLNSLILTGCDLSGKLGKKLLEGVKFSKICWIYLADCNLNCPFISHFAEVVKDTSLEFVDFSKNTNLSYDSLVTLGESIKGSKIKTVVFNNIFKYPNGGALLFAFLEKVNLLPAPLKYDHKYSSLPDTTSCVAEPQSTLPLSCLNICSNEIGIGIFNLVNHLKFSFFTRLFLDNNNITDEGVKALVGVLSETRLITLTLNNNQITSCGAETLATALEKSTLLHLGLRGNQIENDGMEALAKGAENTFLIQLSLTSNPGNRQLLVDSVLWNNKTSTYHFVNAFKLIAPQNCSKHLCFDGDIGSQDVLKFSESCLHLYKTFCEKPSAVSVLLEDRSLSLSREHIVFLMFEDFPSQFSSFVANKIEADVEQPVKLLEQAENMGLVKIVEFLLLHRPLYMIDEQAQILHPYVYKLLSKYNYPLYNLDIEPDRKEKIIRYFSEHIEIEGASDVIRLLRSKRKN